VTLGWELVLAALSVLTLIGGVGWLFLLRQRDERTLRRQLEQQLRDAEELRARAREESAEHQKIANALRDSESRYRALAVRMSRLHALTASLSQALTIESVARAVVHEGKALLGAQAGAVMQLGEGEQLIRVYAQGDSPDVPEGAEFVDLAPGLCSTEVATARHPVFVSSFAEWQKRCPLSAPVAGDAGYASIAVLPLFLKGGLWGVLAFHFTAPVNFDEGYQALLTVVAHHCGDALDRARLYEVEQRGRTEAEATSRSKDEFLSTVSHELRTPLNAILGWASMLRSGSLDARGAARAVHVIYDNAQRQRQLIDDLLDISRMMTGRTALEIQELDLGHVITSAVESVMPQAEAKGVTLRFVRRGTVRMMADARRLEQVFLNLLTNAVKFTPAGGQIDVSMTTGDHIAEIRVSDSGVGIEPAFLPYVFDPFRQADSQSTRSHGGLGLGLSIAKRLVDAHEGSIRAESEGAGKGTTFIVTLPAVASDRQTDTAVRDFHERQRDHLPDLRGIRILAVDDDADGREIVATTFETCRATVISAASAAQAMDLLLQNDVDVLLVDIAMPGEDGYTFIRKVRALPSSAKASLPAAALTAYARDDQRQEALAAGFQMHIAKPVEPSQLAWSIVMLLKDRSSRASGF
jgi:signal transduction histidine kinase/CheY-like chemotaxis protein